MGVGETHLIITLLRNFKEAKGARVLGLTRLVAERGGPNRLMEPARHE